MSSSFVLRLCGYSTWLSVLWLLGCLDRMHPHLQSQAACPPCCFVLGAKSHTWSSHSLHSGPAGSGGKVWRNCTKIFLYTVFFWRFMYFLYGQGSRDRDTPVLNLYNWILITCTNWEVERKNGSNGWIPEKSPSWTTFNTVSWGFQIASHSSLIHEARFHSSRAIHGLERGWVALPLGEGYRAEVRRRGGFCSFKVNTDTKLLTLGFWVRSKEIPQLPGILVTIYWSLSRYQPLLSVLCIY